MTKKRRVMSCGSCRRLKTRCEVQLGRDKCNRCEKLRLDCSLPFATSDLGQTESSPSVPRTGVGEDNNPLLSGSLAHQACSGRFAAIEKSLAEIKNLLRSCSQTEEAGNLNKTFSQVSDTGSPSQRIQDVEPETRSPSVATAEPLLPAPADRNVHTAPISVVRDMKTLITGPFPEDRPDGTPEDLFSMGIVTEALGRALLEGFMQMSSRWKFVTSDFSTLRQNSPLLFSVCLLAGIQTIPSLHISDLHNSLHAYTKDLLGKSMLKTPLPLPTIQSLLTLSIWNLVPDRNGKYTDSWLLTGNTIMHAMLAFDFSKFLTAPLTAVIDADVREAVRTWNLACLSHLQFAIGTGRPSVVGRDYLEQCINIVKLSSFEACDRIAAAELELYTLLYGIIASGKTQPCHLSWSEIEGWWKRQADFYNAESAPFLDFTYSCVYLILSRRALKDLYERSATGQEPVDNAEPSINELIDLSLRHSHRILERLVVLCSTTASVKPVYDLLLGSYAAVTLIEFPTYLVDIAATLALMEKFQLQSQKAGRVELVFQWATNVMRKTAADFSQRDERVEPEAQDASQELFADWIPDLLVSSVFPADQADTQAWMFS